MSDVGPIQQRRLLKTQTRKIPDPLPAPFKTQWTQIDLEHSDRSIHFLSTSTYKVGCIKSRNKMI